MTSFGTATIMRGDAGNLPLADNSVDLVVTSPPYWAQRSYKDGGQHYSGQIGDEPTPAAFIDNLTRCTAEWSRVLKPGGSMWVNLGDKYATRYASTRGAGRAGLNGDDASRGRTGQNRTGVPEKSLIGLPWRYAIGCIDQLGLILRAEVIWSKPNGLPESVTDRVRRSHEQWFHLVKQPRYYTAVDRIREASTSASPEHDARRRSRTDARLSAADAGMVSTANPLGKLPGSVWEIATQPLTVPDHVAHGRCCAGVKRAGCEDGLAHHAAFPMEWPRRIIQGWSPSGICTACGEGRRPAAAGVGLDMTRPQARRAHELAAGAGLTEAHFAALLAVGVSDTGRGAATQSGTGRNTDQVYALAGEARTVLGGYAREYLLRRPTSFREACACPDASAPTRPAVVLDPFGGTGTTATVAKVLGRRGVTVDHSADYCRLAQWRTNDPKQLAKAAGVKPAGKRRAKAVAGVDAALFDHPDLRVA